MSINSFTYLIGPEGPGSSFTVYDDVKDPLISEVEDGVTIPFV